MSTSLDATFGAAFIGVVVAAFLAGISALQAFYYFVKHWHKDPLYLKVLVSAVVLFDFVHQALISHTVYYYLVINYGNLAVLGTVIWSLLAEVLFNGFAAFCVQCFLAFRVWRLSNSNFWLTALVMTFVLAEFGCVLAFGIIALLRVRTFEELATELKALSVTVNVLAACGDVLIASTLTYLLQTSKTGLGRSDTMLNRLILFAVNTGALTSLCAVASLASILAAPNTFIYISFFFCLGRLYTNSLLATLNARKMIRNAGNKAQTTTGQNISFTFRSFTKASSFASLASSFGSKNRDGEQGGISIHVDTTKEERSGDYGSPSQYELQSMSHFSQSY